MRRSHIYRTRSPGFGDNRADYDDSYSAPESQIHYLSSITDPMLNHTVQSAYILIGSQQYALNYCEMTKPCTFYRVTSCSLVSLTDFIFMFVLAPIVSESLRLFFLCIGFSFSIAVISSLVRSYPFYQRCAEYTNTFQTSIYTINLSNSH